MVIDADIMAFKTIKITDEIKKNPKYAGYIIMPSLRVFGIPKIVRKYFIGLGVPEISIDHHIQAGTKL